MSSAAEIVAAIGGSANIKSLTHCATRLRFELYDAKLVDSAKVEQVKGVMGAVPQSGDRYQVICGGGVASVFNEINNLPEMANRKAPAADGEMSDADIKAAARAGGIRGKAAWIDNFFEYLSDSFRPMLGVLLGASLVLAAVAVLDALGIVDSRATDKTATWIFVDAMWRSVFYFMPLMVAYNASKKLNVDPWVGTAVMAAVMTPEFLSLAKSADTVCTTNQALGTESCVAEVFGLSMQLNSYGGQVFVPLIMVAVLAPVYKLWQKVIPESLHIVFVPFFSMLVMIPVTAFLIGPLGVWIGTGLGSGLGWLNTNAPLVFAILIPLLYPFLVPLGLHWPLNALMLANIQTLGYDFIQGPMGAWNFACFGATAGVLVIAIRDKEKTMRQTATGALAAGLLGGISEPSLYGIHLRYKRIYPRMITGCLAGGITIGVLSMISGSAGLQTNAFVFTSILTIPVFKPMWIYVVAILLAFITSFLAILITDYRTPEQRQVAKAGKDLDAVQSEPEVIVVTDVETNQAKQWIEALGGEDNVENVELLAETRLRVTVADSSKVDVEALRKAGLPAAIAVSPGVWHLVAGLEADHFESAMRRRLSPSNA
ncbi:PTS transporter subunit EIIC [Actinotignum urinale]|uniref:PTS transporter subunit EIIC n=1 Tax=Actinotignum urinale TaxID=190146 RepID=UPI002A7FD6BF|nr:PTS transporter subunit EIIC [Actinotignum urinale]MDY5129230.1 PTS transporter subunit EIIC [Actinotignum urinale]